MPVFTAAQRTAFFEGADQMGLDARTRQQLVTEGISDPSHLERFHGSLKKTVLRNLRKPSGMVPDPANPGGPQIPERPFPLGATSEDRLEKAGALVRYYNCCGRDLTPANMRWPVIQAFTDDWLDERDLTQESTTINKSEESAMPQLPIISKLLPIMQWTIAMEKYLPDVIGIRDVPLAYVIRADDPPVHLPALLPNLPYCEENGSCRAELIAFTSHTHVKFRRDNARVFKMIDKAVHGTNYAATLSPFSFEQDGRGAWQALAGQHAGKDKWDAEHLRANALLVTKWNGQGHKTMEQHVAQHRNAFVTLEQCSLYTTVQVPHEHTRVGMLLASIESHDSSMSAAKSYISNDPSATHEIRGNFEVAASALIRACPVAGKQNSGKRVRISDATAAPSGAADSSPKSGIGKTGVELRYHSVEEFKKLSEDQRSELREHRDRLEAAGGSRRLSGKKNGGNKNKKARQNKRAKGMKAMINSAIANALKPTPASASAVDAAAAASPDPAEIGSAFLAFLESKKPSGPNARVSEASVAAPTAAASLPESPRVALLQKILAKAKPS